MRKKHPKEYTISARCTQEEYARIHSMAQKRDQSISEYLLDSKVQWRSGRKKIKHDIPILVDLQESANELTSYLTEHPNTDPLLIKNITRIIEGVPMLWEK